MTGLGDLGVDVWSRVFAHLGVVDSVRLFWVLWDARLMRGYDGIADAFDALTCASSSGRS